MKADNQLDIMMIGHFAKDRLVVDCKAELASGGAVYYGSVVLRRLDKRVAIVTRMHPDDFPLLDELRAEGVQVFAAPAPATSGIENAYDSADTHATADCDRNGRPYAHADCHADADPYALSVTDLSAVGWRGLDRVQRVCGR